MQSSAEFAMNEAALKRKREMDNLDKDTAGGNAQTVYRDKSGKKVDALNEYMKQQTAGEAMKTQLEEVQYEWGKGSVQKQDIVDAQQELLAISAEPFARTADNPRLEAHRKAIIRDGDPMAAFLAAKNQSTKSESTQSEAGVAVKKRLVYSGPTPTPNRFGIRPGYRWDAVNRGNGFEHKMLTRMNDKNSLKEDEYKWSVSDL